MSGVSSGVLGVFEMRVLQGFLHFRVFETSVVTKKYFSKVKLF